MSHDKQEVSKAAEGAAPRAGVKPLPRARGPYPVRGMRRLTYWDIVRDREAPHHERQSAAMRSLAMTMDGLAGALDAGTKRMRITDRVRVEEIQAVVRRAKHVQSQIEKLLRSVDLEGVDLATLDRFSESCESAAESLAGYLGECSVLRARLAMRTGERLLRELAENQILDSLFSAEDILRPMISSALWVSKAAREEPRVAAAL